MSILFPHINETNIGVLDMAAEISKDASKGFVIGCWLRLPSHGYKLDQSHDILIGEFGAANGNDAYLETGGTSPSTITFQSKRFGSTKFSETVAMPALGKRFLVLIIVTDANNHLVTCEPGQAETVSTTTTTTAYDASWTTSIGLLRQINLRSGEIEELFMLEGLFPEAANVPDSTLIGNIADGTQDLDTLDAQLTSGVERFRFRMLNKDDLSDAWGNEGDLVETNRNTSTGFYNRTGGVLRPRALQPAATGHHVCQATGFTPGDASAATATVYVEGGTYSGISPTAIQARLLDRSGAVVVDWTEIDGAPSGGTWVGGALAYVPATPYMMDLQFRAVDGVGAQIDEIVPSDGLRGVGFNIVIQGQSQAQYMFSDGAGLALNAGSDMLVTWVDTTTAYNAFVSSGYLHDRDYYARGVSNLVTEIQTIFPGYPVHVTDASIPGTSLHEFGTGGTYLGFWQNLADWWGVTVPFLFCFFGHSSGASGNGYEADLDDVYGHIKAALGTPVKTLISPTNRYSNLVSNASQNNRNEARDFFDKTAEAFWIGSMACVYTGEGGPSDPHPADTQNGQGRAGSMVAWGAMAATNAVIDRPQMITDATGLGSSDIVLSLGPVNDVLRVPDQNATFGADTLASAGGWQPVDANGALVALASVDDQTGTTRTWSISGGYLIANGTPGVDDTQTIDLTTTTGKSLTATVATTANEYSARTTAEVNAAFTDIGAGGGATVRFRTGTITGNVGGTRIKNYTFAADVTLTGETGTVVNGGLSLQSISGLIIDSLEVTLSGFTDIYGILTFTKDCDVTVQDCELYGDYYDPLGDLSAGIDNASGIRSVASSGINDLSIVLKRNLIYQVGNGMVWAGGATGFEIVDNEIYHCYHDAFKFTVIPGAALTATKEFSRNVIYDFIGRPTDTGNPHIDVFQFLSSAANDGLDCENFTATQNVVWENQATARGLGVQGITGFDDGGNNVVLKNPVVSGNLLAISGNHHITFETVDGGTFENNTLINPSSTYTEVGNARVSMGAGSSAGTITVDDNVADLAATESGAATYNSSGNIVLGTQGATISYATEFDGDGSEQTTFSATKTAWSVASGTAGAIGSGYGVYGDARDETGWSIMVPDQNANYRTDTLASAGGWQPVDANGSRVALASVDDQTGATRTWSVSGGFLIANGTPSVDNAQTIDLTTTTGESFTATIVSTAAGYNARTIPEAEAAIISLGATGGKTVEFRDTTVTGTIDRMADGITFTSPLTVTQETNAPKLPLLYFQNCHNVIIENIEGRGVWFYGSCSDLIIQDNEFYESYHDPLGDYSSGGYDNTISQINTVSDGSNQSMSGTIRRNIIRDCHTAATIYCDHADGISITDNEIYRMYFDGIKFIPGTTGAAAPLEISRNVMYHPMGLTGDPSGAHVDFVQIQTGLVDIVNLTMRQNVMWEDPGSARGLYTQGITSFGNGSAEPLHTDNVISGNLIITSGNHPISLDKGVRGTFVNNTGVYTPGAAGSNTVHLKIGDTSSSGNIDTRNNVFDGYTLSGGGTFDTDGNVTLGLKGATISYATQFDGNGSTLGDFGSIKTAWSVASGTAGAVGSGYGVYGNVRDETGWSFDSSYESALPAAVGDWVPSATSCWTDSVGGTQAGAGDDVAVIQDESGNGNHIVFAAGKRPPLQQTAGTGEWYLDFDGAADTGSVAIDLSAGDSMTMVSAWKLDATGAVESFYEYSANLNTTAGAFGVYSQTSGKATIQAHNVTTGSGYSGYITSAILTTAAVITEAVDFSGNTRDTEMVHAMVNGAEDKDAASGTYSDANPNFPNSTLYIGARGGSSLYFDGRWYGMRLHDSVLGASDRAAVETYISDNTPGVSI